MASFRSLMRLLTAALLLLRGSGTNGRARNSAHRHHSSHPTVAAANHGELLAATTQWKHVDTAPPQFLASEATRHHRRAQSAPSPTRNSVSLCSRERTTAQAARPPPFQV